MVKTKEKQNNKVFFDPAIKTMYVDSISIAGRNDNKILMSMQQNIPGDMKLECFRMLIDNKHGKEIANILCERLNYYPKKS